MMEFTNIRYLRGIPGLLKPFGVRIKVDNEAVRIIRFGNIKASIPLTSIKDVTVEKSIDWNVIITFEKEGVHNNCVLQVQSFLKERTANKLANIILTNRQLASEDGKSRYTKQTSIPKSIENYSTGASKIFGVMKTLIITGVALLFLLVIVSILLTPPSSNKGNPTNEIINKTESSSTSTPAKDVLVENVQKRLNTLGIKVGKADGIYGPKTKSAIIKFQEEYGLKTDGRVSELLLLRLENALTAKSSSTKDQTTKQVEKTAESNKKSQVTISNWEIGSIVSLKKNIGEGVMFATSKSALESLSDCVVSNDEEGFLMLLASGGVIVLEDGTKARVLDTPLLSGWAKVRILEGDYNLWVGYVLMSP